MAVAPYYDFTIGDKSLDELGIRYLIKSITFEEEIGKFCNIKMVLKSGPELATAYYLLKHGGIFQLSMGYHNGLIKKMGLAFHNGVEPDWGQQTVTINFSDYLRAMSIGDKDRVLKGKTIKQVVQAVVADYAPLVIGVIDNGDVIMSETVSQSKRTDFALLQEIAKSFGMNWHLKPTDTAGIWSISLKKMNFDKDSAKYETMYAFPDKENQEITKNIHLKGFKVKSNILGDIPSNVTIESNNPNQPIEVNSKLYDEGKYVSEARGSEIVFTIFGQVNRIQFYENVTDEEAAQIIADQMLQDEELKFVQGRDIQLSEGRADVRIGQRRHIVPKGLGLFDKVFEGDYLLTRTKHQIDVNSGYSTWVNVGRESLTVPPPPELTSAGQPVVILIQGSEIIRGWYVSFNKGEIVYGGNISREEILANSYWMSKIVPRTGYAPSTLLGLTTDPVSGSQYYSSGENTVHLGATNIYTQSDIPQFQGVAIYIDFPDQYTANPLAENVAEPSIAEPLEHEPPGGPTTTYGFAEGSFLGKIDAFRAEQEFNARIATLYTSNEVPE